MQEYIDVNVTMKDNVFTPKRVTVDPGATIHWPNEGYNEHNVIPDKKKAEWGDKLIGVGEEYEFKFAKPGVYEYFCSIHGSPGRGMFGSITVRNADGTVPSSEKGKAPSETATSSGKSKTIRVPADAKTIQGGVDKANPGDMVLVSPGVYHEAVLVTTDRVVIRGLDRNKTILDGRYELENGIKIIGANGVVVENMTARRYERNGFFWTGVKGYRGSYLTATRTGDYGIYAFDSVEGILDHDYGSGSPDAGFYIGQCFPCDSIIRDSISEYNGLGYSGTNASGNLVIANSIWRYNRAGIVPNSGDGEALAPQRKATVIGNLVYSNNNGETPAIGAAKLAQGNGILIAGGSDNLVTKNRVWDHDIAGIVSVLNPDKTVFFANRNRVINNIVSDSGEGDLATFGGEGNCFSDNVFKTSKPSNIEQVHPCPTGVGVPATDELDLQKYIDASKPPSVDYKIAKTPKPPVLAGMKNPKGAKAVPAVGIKAEVNKWKKANLKSIRMPKAITNMKTT
ncbi:MAG: right-handed parallel beta-helix repeat-containing protein, partial [Acidimicrobiia bacterium]|nr:right-handed parallel beta-helix repeat-containing protein [Acidimicrobiia bacterium]